MRADSAKRGNQSGGMFSGRPPAKDVRVFQEDNVLFNAEVLAPRAELHLHLIAGFHLHASGGCDRPRRPTAPPKVLMPRRPDVEYKADTSPALPHPDQRWGDQFQDCPRSGWGSLAGHWRDWLPATDYGLHRGRSTCSGLTSSCRSGQAGCGGSESCGSWMTSTISSPSPIRPTACTHRELGLRRHGVPLQLLVVGDAGADPRLRPPNPHQEDLEAAGDPQWLRPSRYQVRRLMVAARDGERVPLSAPVPKDYPNRMASPPPPAVRLRLVRVDHGARLRLRAC